MVPFWHVDQKTHPRAESPQDPAKPIPLGFRVWRRSSERVVLVFLITRAFHVYSCRHHRSSSSSVSSSYRSFSHVLGDHIVLRILIIL